MIRRLLLGALVLLALGVTAGPAWARWLEVEELRSDITVDPDGSVLVEERITVDFRGRWNGIFRNIKIGYTYAGGVRGTIRVDLLAIEDPDGNELEHWVERTDSYLNLKIRVPGAHDAKRDVVIRYRAFNVVREQDYGAEDYGVMDELYWNVTGDEWQIPIVHATATIRLPAGIPLDLVQTTGYTGRYGERGGDLQMAREEGPLLRFETTRKLAPGEGLTAVVLFPPGHVAHPSLFRRIVWWVQDNWFLVLPLLLALLWFLAWRRWGRDPMKGYTIIPEWEPPEGLRPAEVGVLVDDQFDQRDLTAAIVDLAVRGVITIYEEEDGDFRLVLHEKALKKASLNKYEKRLLDALFEGDAEKVQLSSLKHEFVVDLKTIRNAVLDRLVGKKYFEQRPDKVLERWTGFTVLAMIGLVVVGWIGGFPLPYWLVSLVCVVFMFRIARVMPRRTKKGLQALARVKGMEEYLVTAEEERMKTLPLDHFEKLLPFAIALGVHKRWAKAFEGLLEKAPEWFRSSTGAFNAAVLSRSLSRVDSSVGSTLMSGPRAAASTGSSGWSGGWSGGGGFSSGGGFSGGGFGGGGGGGW